MSPVVPTSENGETIGAPLGYEERMQLEAETCYRALTSKDARFDGRFFVGVSTTGIYCRPICRARTPKRDRCSFYRSSAEAEKAGFRACFRCRPELAPGSARDEALPRLVARAVAKIEEGCLNEESVDALAAELEVTSRHLRRAMEDVLGVSPIELAQTHRLALAKQLIQDTDMSLVDVAFASGFQSVRRFNALFRARFGCAPSTVRARGEVGSGVRVRLGFRAPLAWEELLAFLGARAIPGVESVEGGVYRRNMRAGKERGTISVFLSGDRSAVIVEVSRSLLRSLMKIVARVRALFDLDADALTIGAHLSKDPLLAPLVANTPGLRVPGAFDPFEMSVRAILGQQVSVSAATTLAGRLVKMYGGEFPSSEELGKASAEEVAKKIGMPKKRAEALIHLAKTGEVRGAWTQTYVAMRAGRDPDAFPETDLGVKKALARHKKANPESWRPWRAYATLYLWTGGLHNEG